MTENIADGPCIELRVRVLPPEGANAFQLELRLCNVGACAAKQPAVQLDDPTDLLEWPSEQLECGLVKRTSATEGGTGRILYEPDRPLVLYSGMDRVLFVVNCKAGQTWHAFGAVAKFKLTLPFKGSLYALDMPTIPFAGAIEILAGRDFERTIVDKRLVLGGAKKEEGK
jgi:hypothetical protein